MCEDNFDVCCQKIFITLNWKYFEMFDTSENLCSFKFAWINILFPLSGSKLIDGTGTGVVWWRGCSCGGGAHFGADSGSFWGRGKGSFEVRAVVQLWLNSSPWAFIKGLEVRLHVLPYLNNEIWLASHSYLVEENTFATEWEAGWPPGLFCWEKSQFLSWSSNYRTSSFD